MKDPEDKWKWIVDEEDAAVVQKVFSLCVDGMGPTQIRNWLREHKIFKATKKSYKGNDCCPDYDRKSKTREI